MDTPINPIRQPNGHFAAGNPGGPGRPPRATERAYLATMLEVVTREEWQAVVQRALDDAKNGDARARLFLATYLLGKEPPRVLDVLAAEAAGVPPEQEVATRATEIRQYLHFAAMLTSSDSDRQADAA